MLEWVNGSMHIPVTPYLKTITKTPTLKTKTLTPQTKTSQKLSYDCVKARQCLKTYHHWHMHA